MNTCFHWKCSDIYELFCLIVDDELELGIATAKHFKIFDLLLMNKPF